MVASDSQENGQRNEEEEEEERKTERDRQRRASKDKRKNSYSEETVEMQSSTKHDAEATKGTSRIENSIFVLCSGMSFTSLFLLWCHDVIIVTANSHLEGL